ncbi:hypothetical protein SARC_01102 [Sphaeroforma arctica JP610]|uniref:Uncharacterized protein n=1 Tax=Sphaeroforma arctica JP610 TaxID=667725 RepID=A0A0L0GES3_9EUKA|nr:hypothetical protein SARC_01102 [Sphaeroforma arctica JP610]KNC86768.1 hypothetical protein SARC_01102 [Sphaeroforma arctica JP610]|eukprot:XP_014160670.1 hypothetical protein SARC_01102 [Sphaeroforma arctica JP610]
MSSTDDHPARGNSVTGSNNPRLSPVKRKYQRRRHYRRGEGRDQGSPQQLAKLMAKQQSLSDNPMGLKGRPSYKRRRLSNSVNNPEFRIRGLGQHHVLGYESPVSDDPATLTDTPSIQEFAREELLVKKNPLMKNT